MANWHIDELLIEMFGAGWSRTAVLPGKHSGIAGFWRMVQISTNRLAVIEFHVESECEQPSISINDSYGCAVRYNPNIALHFYKKRPHWDKHLKQFVVQLDEVETRIAASEASRIENPARDEELVLTA